jgi:hypothetical protein
MAAIQVLVRIKDGRIGSGRERGQIIRIKPVPNEGWGKGEGPPTYKVIEIQGIGIDDPRVKVWGRRHHVEYATGAEAGDVVFTLRSCGKIDLDNLPTAIQEKLEDRGVLQVTSGNVIGQFKDVLSEQRGTR